jgi:DNA-binding response OmpR family regulator
MKQKVFYVEDENYLARIVTDTLELKGYEVMHKKDGLGLLENISGFNPDICVLDVMLPHIDGFSLGSTIRHLYPELPIIFLTAKSQTQDVLEGFSSGGTDYLKKPFSMEELMVRIDNQIRLSKVSLTMQDTVKTKDIRLGIFVYSPGRLELRGPAATIKISNREAEILNILCMHQNQTLNRRKLMQMVWGDDSYFISRNLDVYIRRLRDYFATTPEVSIITLKGKGYHFSVG